MKIINICEILWGWSLIRAQAMRTCREGISPRAPILFPSPSTAYVEISILTHLICIFACA